MDFERTIPEFDKAKYKGEKLREEVKDTLILLSVIRERLPKLAMAIYCLMQAFRAMVEGDEQGDGNGSEAEEIQV